MDKRGSIAYTLDLAKPSFFGYFELPEFSDPSYSIENAAPKSIYDRRERLTAPGLSYLLKAKSCIGKRLSELRDALFRDGDKSKLVSDLAGDAHRLIDQAESFEIQLRRANLPIIKDILERELTQKGIGKILSAGHSLTDLVEKCALDVLHYLGEFDPRKTATDYYAFIRERIKSSLNGVANWEEFKEALDSGVFSLKDQIIRDVMSKVPRRNQRIVLTRLYGLDGKKETKEELARSMNTSPEKIERLEKQALTHLGIKIDPIGFLNSFHAKDSRKELERKNRTLWRYLEDRGDLTPSLRRDYGYNPISFYRKRYPGVSRGKLPYIDNPLYLALKYHRQLHLVPTLKELEEGQS